MIEWFLRHGHHCQRTSFERVFEFVHWVALNESDTWRDGSMRSLVLRLRSLGDNESELSKSLDIWTLTVVDVKFQDSNLYQENMVSALEQWRRSAWDPKNVGAVVAYQCWPIGPHGPFVAFLRNQGTWIEVLSSWPPTTWEVPTYFRWGQTTRRGRVVQDVPRWHNRWSKEGISPQRHVSRKTRSGKNMRAARFALHKQECLIVVVKFAWIFDVDLRFRLQTTLVNDPLLIIDLNRKWSLNV